MAQQGEQTTETKKVNTDFLSTYDFVEGTDFEGLMPAVMETLGEDYVTGKSDENVHYHGFMALGSDSLEVIDIAAFYKSEGSEGNESSSNTDDNQDTTTEDGDGN